MTKEECEEALGYIYTECGIGTQAKEELDLMQNLINEHFELKEELEGDKYLLEAMVRMQKKCNCHSQTELEEFIDERFEETEIRPLKRMHVMSGWFCTKCNHEFPNGADYFTRHFEYCPYCGRKIH